MLIHLPTSSCMFLFEFSSFHCSFGHCFTKTLQQMFNFHHVSSRAILYKGRASTTQSFSTLHAQRTKKCLCLVLLTWKHCSSDRTRAPGSSHQPNTAASLELTPDLEKSFYSTPVPFITAITSSFEKGTSLFESSASIPYHTQLLSQYTHSVKTRTNTGGRKKEKNKICFLSEESLV